MFHFSDLTGFFHHHQHQGRRYRPGCRPARDPCGGSGTDHPALQTDAGRLGCHRAVLNHRGAAALLFCGPGLRGHDRHGGVRCFFRAVPCRAVEKKLIQGL